MARDLKRGCIWLYEFKKPDKRRPVLILSRQDVIGLIDTVIVAPITSTIYGVPSEVIVGIDQGLKHECAVNLDHIQTVSASKLCHYVGYLDESLMGKVCFALRIAAGCD
ncbi:MAG: type II toxin-antitoxin system PemK/MazF family toxin [Desulfobacterales bacterium]|nr:type II toxin-antitoxin system PemK/MazF family toxin [Desulfobacterales bacterium]